jgi:L-alanine-DL-glutamate epimerase-like enolase superfamily enzyme
MKVTDVECFVLLDPDYNRAACSSAQDDLVVKIHAEDGSVGIGEADVNPWAAKALIEAPGTHCMGYGLKEMLIGADPFDVEAIWQRMYVSSAMNTRRGLGICAIGALDMALWDLRGKLMGQPIWQMIGGGVRDAITPYASLLPTGRTLEEQRESLVRKAQYAVEHGFRAVKLEVCVRGPYAHNELDEGDDAIVEIVGACRDIVGPEVTLMVDVAYCWEDAKAALRVMKRLEPFDLFFLETPIPSDDLDGHATVAERSSIRVASGEWLTTRFEFIDLMDRGKVDVVQPDVGRVGGITEALRVARLAQDRNRLVIPHCWKSAIGIAASVHIGAVMPNCPFIEFLPRELSESRLRRDLVQQELPLIGGKIPLPRTPGLGVQLNEQALAEYDAFRRVGR